MAGRYVPGSLSKARNWWQRTARSIWQKKPRRWSRPPAETRVPWPSMSRVPMTSARSFPSPSGSSVRRPLSASAVPGSDRCRIFELSLADWDRVSMSTRGARSCQFAPSRRRCARLARFVVAVASNPGSTRESLLRPLLRVEGGRPEPDKSFAVALAGDGVRVNSVAPGIVDTVMWRAADTELARLRGVAPGEPRRQRVARGASAGRHIGRCRRGRRVPCIRRLELHHGRVHSCLWRGRDAVRAARSISRPRRGRQREVTRSGFQTSAGKTCMSGSISMSPTRTVTEADVVMFAAMTGDYSELHTSEAFAPGARNTAAAWRMGCSVWPWPMA